MFRNFIILAYRHFIRSPIISFIEIFGMTAALTISILMLLWASNELSFDLFNENHERIYRLEWLSQNSTSHNHRLLEETIEDKIPGLERVVMSRYVDKERLHKINDFDSKEYFSADVLYTDEDFLQTFSYELISGDLKSALMEKNTIVLTESLAQSMFSEVDPVGNYLFDGSGNRLKITGVVEDIANSHFSFKALRSIVTLEDRYQHGEWRLYHLLYLLLHPETDIKLVENDLDGILNEFRKKIGRPERYDIKAHLRPLSDIYFNGDAVYEKGYSRHGDKQKVFAYGSVIVFSLLLACINFINLSTAKFLERAKEIGIKKASGASKNAIFFQFFGEVGIVCLISLLLAMVFAHSLLSQFNQLMNVTLSMNAVFELQNMVLIIGGMLILALLAGGIPALYTSTITPVKAIKSDPGNPRKSVKQFSLIIQFSITVLLLVGIITILRQIRFMKDAELGFDENEIVAFDFDDIAFPDKNMLLKETLLRHPDVLAVSQTTGDGVPGINHLDDIYLTDLRFGDEKRYVNEAFVDDDYLKLLGIELIEGRFFDRSRPGDHTKRGERPEYLHFVINESAKEVLGFEDPLGKVGIVTAIDQPFKIIGVIKDFHLNGLKSEIPAMIFVWFDDIGTRTQFMVKISGPSKRKAIRFIEEEVEKIIHQKPEIEFIDQSISKQYGQDDNFARLLIYLTILVVSIGSMGLLGIFMHSIKIRIKEIGIRKVLGASALQIVSLLTSSFIKTILVSSALATPLGWLVMNNWLANYPYRIEMDYTIFLLAIGLTVIIALVTIGTRCWQASNENPARLIRYE